MNKRLKVLLVGCGDIGQQLAAELPADHFNVTGLRRSSRASKEVESLTMVAGDATDSDTMSDLLLLGFDVVVVTMTPSARSEQGYRDSYLKATEALLTAINSRANKPPLVLFVSSTGVYGQNSGEWVDEQSATEPTGFSGRVLLESEQLLQSSGVPNSIVRFSGIYGPGRNRLLEQVRTGMAPAHPFSWSNRIHSADCAGILHHLIERFRKGESLEPIYIGTDHAPVMHWQVRGWLADQLGVEPQLVPEGDFEESGKRCCHELLAQSGYHWRFPDYQSGYTAVMQSYQQQ